jgi:hypothetical protein
MATDTQEASDAVQGVACTEDKRQRVEVIKGLDSMLETIQKVAVKIIERGYCQDVWLVQDISGKIQELKSRWRKQNG